MKKKSDSISIFGKLAWALGLSGTQFTLHRKRPQARGNPNPKTKKTPIRQTCRATLAQGATSKHTNGVVQAALDDIARMNVERELSLTQSQRDAMKELEVRAQLLFSASAYIRRGIPIQVNSLIIGPTGSGKTIVAESLAHRIGAVCIKCSYSGWIPEGAIEGNPTIRLLVRSACYAERVVLFIDELDKFFTVTDGQGWGTSVLNELWMVLDRSLSWEGLIQKPNFTATLPEDCRTAEKINHEFRTKVFIVAAGTWQGAFTPQKTAGFTSSDVSGQSDPLEWIMKRGALPEEVLRRFNSDVLTLSYPEEAELRELIDRDKWLKEYAGETGAVIDVHAIRQKMNTVGMTAVTSFKTQLALEVMGGRT